MNIKARLAALSVDQVERALAGLLLCNGGLGLVVGWAASAGGLPYLSLFGLLCGLLSWRGARIGAWGGLVYYALQSFSFFGPAGSFSLKSGLSLALVTELAGGVLVINLFALAALFATAVFLRWRVARPQA